MSRPGVVTVGSIHIDLVAYTGRRPKVGETLNGEGFTISAGGKGTNQAIQAALSGAGSALVARIGNDVFAPVIHNILAETGVDTTYVIPDAAGTGIGHVVVDGDGDYTAIIIPRASGQLAPGDIERAAPAFAKAKVLLLQLEIPLATCAFAAHMAHTLGLTVFLNAAPAVPLPAELLQFVDVLIVNEIEAEMLTGIPLGSDPMAPTGPLAALRRQVGNVVISLGEHGVVAEDAAGRQLALSGHRVPVVNTIGAGDAFIGELAARMAEGVPLLAALPFANAAGALAVTQAASQGLRPNRLVIEKMVKESTAQSREGEGRMPAARE